MRDTSSRGWHRWRVTVAAASLPAPVFDRMRRASANLITTPSMAHTEAKGPDGIRHELVARIRQQIADGTYDTDEKWLAAEESLLRRVEGIA
jgi:Anti-sigma-28 factor, FlgM